MPRRPDLESDLLPSSFSFLRLGGSFARQFQLLVSDWLPLHFSLQNCSQDFFDSLIPSDVEMVFPCKPADLLRWISQKMKPDSIMARGWFTFRPAGPKRKPGVELVA